MAQRTSLIVHITLLGFILLLLFQLIFLIKGAPLFLEKTLQYDLSDITFRMLKGGTSLSYKIAYLGMVLLILAQLFFIQKRLSVVKTIRNRFGTQKSWLWVHCGLDIVAAILILIHSGFPFSFTYANPFKYIHLELGLRGLVGFQGLAAWMVLLSVISGFFGKYFFNKLNLRRRFIFRRWRFIHLTISVILYVTGTVHLVLAVWFRYISASA